MQEKVSHLEYRCKAREGAADRRLRRWRTTADCKELSWTTKDLELRAKEREGWKNTGQHYAPVEYKVGYD